MCVPSGETLITFLKKKKTEIVTGVEIGTHSIKVVMGEVLEDGSLNVLGVGEASTLHKVMKGEVQDFGLVKEKLEHALDEAERESGAEIGPVFLAVTGGHIRSMIRNGSTIVDNPDRMINESIVNQAVRNARSYPFPPDQIGLHSMERRYIIDDGREVVNPIGMPGMKLEAEVMLVYAQVNRADANCRLLEDVMSYPPSDMAFSPSAAAYAALGEEDHSQGILLIDIGAGVTEYILANQSHFLHAGQVTVGCEHIVNDLAIGLNLPHPRCRRILQNFDKLECSALMNPDGRNRIIPVELSGGKLRNIPASSVEQITEMRLEELFEVVLNDLRKHNVTSRIGRGAALCGGGACIPGIEKIAKRMLKMPVRTAVPVKLTGKTHRVNSPAFVTPAGLVRWGCQVKNIEENETKPLGNQLKTDFRTIISTFKRAFHW